MTIHRVIFDAPIVAGPSGKMTNRSHIDPTRPTHQNDAHSRFSAIFRVDRSKGHHLNIARIIGLLALSASLFGCGNPVPPEKAAYVGEWQAKTVYLLITEDGSVRYKRLKAGVTTSIDGPLKGFDGNNFEAGIGPLATTFVVSKPPYQDGEEWKMVVDNVELTKTTE